jgi:hypothetical protein
MTVRILGGAGLWSTADSGNAFNTAMDPPNWLPVGTADLHFCSKIFAGDTGKITSALDACDDRK